MLAAQVPIKNTRNTKNQDCVSPPNTNPIIMAYKDSDLGEIPDKELKRMTINMLKEIKINSQMSAKRTQIAI